MGGAQRNPSQIHGSSRMFVMGLTHPTVYYFPSGGYGASVTPISFNTFVQRASSVLT